METARLKGFLARAGEESSKGYIGMFVATASMRRTTGPLRVSLISNPCPLSIWGNIDCSSYDGGRHFFAA